MMEEGEGRWRKEKEDERGNTNVRSRKVKTVFHTAMFEVTKVVYVEKLFQRVLQQFRK